MNETNASPIYPSDFPMDAVKRMAGYLTGAPPQKQQAVADGYVVLGYALGQMVGEPHMFGEAQPLTADDTDKANFLEGVAKAHEGRRAGMQKLNINWEKLGQIALGILMKFLVA